MPSVLSLYQKAPSASWPPSMMAARSLALAVKTFDSGLFAFSQSPMFVTCRFRGDL